MVKMIELRRDWFGIEPLHFMIVDGTLIKAPTIKDLMAHQGYSYDKIQTVRSGHIVTFNPDSGNTSIKKYYELPEGQIKDTLEEASKKIRKLLEQGATKILQEVTALMLSGGIDSIITAYLAKQINPNVTAYTLSVRGYEAKNADLPFALRASNKLGLKLNVVTIPSEKVKRCIDDVIYAAEDKRDYNIYSAVGAYLLGKRIAKENHKIISCGEGPDEIFGSYNPWGSYDVSSEEAKNPEFRRKFVKRLEWNLSRGTKTLRYLGLRIVSPFLTREFIEYAVNLPAETVNIYEHRKGILAKAFEDVIPKEILLRPKTRFQDGSGITKILKESGIDNKYIEKVYDRIFKKT